ncbi:hypothetical protein UR09_03980 [Candidatus Nitromaritima sp. SCGC AAA799-A02]|nr:hypothetical protein UR09_03980 [Candidatus Nitromaritima sp. SCGC AAA799-A02]
MGWREILDVPPPGLYGQKDKSPPKEDLLSFCPFCPQGLKSEKSPVGLEEAVRLYRRHGWVKIFSTYLNQAIYLVKNQKVKVPNPAIPRYTQGEVEALKGLTFEELKTLYEAKVIFEGKINYSGTGPGSLKGTEQVTHETTRRTPRRTPGICINESTEKAPGNGTSDHTPEQSRNSP